MIQFKDNIGPQDDEVSARDLGLLNTSNGRAWIAGEWEPGMPNVEPQDDGARSAVMTEMFGVGWKKVEYDNSMAHPKSALSAEQWAKVPLMWRGLLQQAEACSIETKGGAS